MLFQKCLCVTLFRVLVFQFFLCLQKRRERVAAIFGVLRFNNKAKAFNMTTLPIKDLKEVLGLNKAVLAATTIWGILTATVAVIGAANLDCDVLKGFIVFGIVLSCVSSLADFVFEVAQDTCYVNDLVHKDCVLNLLDLPSQKYQDKTKFPRYIYWRWCPVKFYFDSNQKASACFNRTFVAWILLFVESIIRLGSNTVLLLAFVGATGYPWYETGCDASHYTITKKTILLRLVYSCLASVCLRFFLFFTYPDKKTFEAEAEAKNAASASAPGPGPASASVAQSGDPQQSSSHKSKGKEHKVRV